MCFVWLFQPCGDKGQLECHTCANHKSRPSARSHSPGSHCHSSQQWSCSVSCCSHPFLMRVCSRHDSVEHIAIKPGCRALGVPSPVCSAHRGKQESLVLTVATNTSEAQSVCPEAWWGAGEGGAGRGGAGHS